MDITAPKETLTHQLIPTFSLYGEDQWPTPDLLHWESVAERSVLHEWIIKPHRHGNLWQVLFLSKGDATAQFDGRESILQLPCLLVVPQLCVHGFKFSADIDGHVVTLAAPLIQSISENLGEVENLLQSYSVIAVDKQNKAVLSNLFASVAHEYKAHERWRDFALRSLVDQLILWIVRHNHAVGNKHLQTNRGQRYFSDFTRLVENSFREHSPLQAYADELGISKPHLNSVCRQYANCSALQVIHQRLLLEAKRNLIYTAMTVSDISNALGFSEPPYFTRFFKRFENVSPLEFRQQQNNQQNNQLNKVTSVRLRI